MECVSGGNHWFVECVSGSSDCLMECASGGNDCLVECAHGMKYLMCGGTPCVVPIECGRKQGLDCKKTEENSRHWQCIGGMGVSPLCGHLIWQKKSQHLQGGYWIML
jgi:hypothetical protein